MIDIDPFAIFRTTLFIALVVYTLVTTVGSILRVAVVLSGSDPEKRLLRAYLSYQLVSVRIRPLAGELLEIAFWVAVLLGLWWLYTKI